MRSEAHGIGSIKLPVVMMLHAQLWPPSAGFAVEGQLQLRIHAPARSSHRFPTPPLSLLPSVCLVKCTEVVRLKTPAFMAATTAPAAETFFQANKKTHTSMQRCGGAALAGRIVVINLSIYLSMTSPFLSSPTATDSPSSHGRRSLASYHAATTCRCCLLRPLPL